jgi:hypothetical protein
MADTTELEMIAEDLVSHYLQRHGILIAKPKFDKEGGDLLAMLGVKDGAHFCRIQSKGRSLYEEKSQSNVKVTCSYVTDSFVVLIYVDDGKLEKTHLYCCFAADLKAEPWVEKDGKYVLYLNKSDFEVRMKKFTVDTKGEVANKIKEAIRKADVGKEIIYVYDQQQVPLPKEIEIQRDVKVVKSGASWVPHIYNPVTKVEYIGNPCPGNDPNKFEYDQLTDTWKVKG